MTPKHDIPYAPDPAPRESAPTQGGLRDLPSTQGRWLVVALVGAPLAWTIHLLAGYLIVTVWCAESWPRAGVAIGVLTVLCTAAAIATGTLAFRLWKRAQTGMLSDEEPGGPGSWDARMGERGARAAFLSVVSLFLAAMFAFLIVLEGLPPLYTPTCPAMTMP